MLVSNETSKNQYVGDGSATEFAYTFPILDATHIEVYRQLPGQTAQGATLVPTGEYFVNGVGVESGGKVVFKTAPTSGTKLSILRNVPITQLYQYQELDSFPAESHENALAKLTMICQALAERLGRAIVASPTDSTTPDELRNEIFRMYAEILLADQNVKTALGNFFCASITPFTTKKGVLEYEVTSDIPLDPILNNLFLVLGGVAQEPITSFVIVDSNHIRLTFDPGNNIRGWGVTSLSMSSPDIRLIVEASIQKIVAEGDKQAGRVKEFADAAAESAAAAASDAQEVASDKQHVDDVAGQIQGLKIVVNTLNPGGQATASYDPVTGILTLGVPKGDPGDAAIATPTSLGSVMPQTGDEDGLELGEDGKLRSRWATGVQRGSVLVSVTAKANTVPLARGDGSLDESWFKKALDAIAGITAPVGTIVPSFATHIPGYLLCNGAEVSRTTYKNLFAVIKTKFGVGNGSTTFNLPDFRDKTLWGANGNLMTVIAAGLPNITGNFSNNGHAGGAFSDGAFSHDINSHPKSNQGSAADGCAFVFNAARSSAVYGRSSTVQPPAIAVYIFIKY